MEVGVLPAFCFPRSQSSAELTLSSSAFYGLIRQGVVVDGRAGGLVVGRRRDKGGIAVIRQQGDQFYLQKQRIGADDFVLHTGATNSWTKPRRESRIRPFAHLLIMDAIPDNKILWLSWNQTVVKAGEALPHLAVLGGFNAERNPYLFCDLGELFKEPRVELSSPTRTKCVPIKTHECESHLLRGS